MNRPPEPDTRLASATTRRRFLQAVALGTAGATVFAGCTIPEHEFELQSRPQLAEDILSAYDNWYATTCRGCGAGCGVVVRVVEGRAKKVEGNPLHPVNRGKLCARGQALVQEQYHPDRLRGPMRRSGDRGTLSFQATSWDDALDEVVNRLRALQQPGQTGDVWVLTRPVVAHQALILDRFTQAFGARRLTLDPVAELPFREAVQRVFGQDRLPVFDIQRARYILSFGANFLHTWLSPVAYGVRYGIFRQGSYDAGDFRPRAGQPRGYLVQIDPHFSGTAASADEWVPVRPGYEGLLALGIASVLIGEGLADASGVGAFGSLDGYQPERIAGTVGVDAQRIRRIARDFAARGPALAIGGELAGAHTNGTDNIAAILSLNLLAGNVGRPGGVLVSAPSPVPDLPATARASSLIDWLQLTQRLQQGQVQAVLVHEANPVYGLPAALGMRDALLQAPFVVSFSSFLDETTALADLILPSSLALEAWGDSVPEPPQPVPVFSVQQPVVRPFYDTRSFWDVLLVVGEELGGAVQQSLPWPTVEAAVRDGAAKLLPSVPGSTPEGVAFERAWVELLQRGGRWPPGGPASPAAAPGNAPAAQPGGVSWQQPEFAGAEQDYPLSLVVYAHNTLGTGQDSNLPWLQAAPDPVTAMTWQTWAALNPRLARQIGVANGDVVTVETPIGRADVAVYVSPAAPPNVLSLPLGQGHQQSGRWARDRGTNPLTLVAPMTDAATGALAYAATRARLTKTGRHVALPKLGGDFEARQLPEQPVIKVTRLER